MCVSRSFDRATQRGGTIHLDSLKSFNQTLVQTQDRIVSQISLKMDSFFEEAEYPWTSLATPPPPPSNRGGGDASGYLMDLMDFVSTVMMSVLVQLPEFSKEYVYRGALKYCAMVLTVSKPSPPSKPRASVRGYADQKWLERARVR